MQSLVKAFRVDEVAAGFREKPELQGFRDERGRNWLHLCAGVDVSKKSTLNPEDAVRLAEVLLEHGFDINGPAFTEGAWCATPLWYAVARGRNSVLVKFLLRSGSTPEHCLWAAAFREDLAMLEVLIDAGAPLEAIAEEETPLLGAVKTSKFKAAKLLLEAGSDPNFQDVKGMTALHYMLKKGSDKKHYRMFVQHGVRGDVANADQQTASALMLRKRDPEFHRIARQILR